MTAHSEKYETHSNIPHKQQYCFEGYAAISIGRSIDGKRVGRLTASKDIFSLKAPITTAQTTNFVTSFLIFEKNKALNYMRIVCQQTILMKYHAVFVIF